MENKVMSTATQLKDVSLASTKTQRYDAIVVGAGFAGLYMLKRLRALGLSVRVFEAGSNVGGTWFWNKYPGARCDVESLEYSYSFDEDLQQDWVWPERYAEQPVILKYLNHVADRFDLRKDIELNQRISSAHYDSERCQWTLSTQRGEVIEAPFCVMATGCLSTAKLPEIPGIERFKGKWYHSGLWPEQGVDFTGQRVGVIGTGSSAVQMIPLIAKEAKQLYVFQRHANFVVPAHNRPLEADAHQAHQANYVEHRAEAQLTPFCIGGHPKPTKKAFEVSAEERDATYEAKWAKGGAISFLYTYTDLLVSKEANETAGEFVRQKIRQIVKDPQTAEDLCPNDHFIGTKRLCVDTGYFETYNRSNVRLVNVQKSAIQQIEPEGLKTESESFALDAIVFATGFDAMTGALFEIDIRGKQGVELKTKWADGPATYLGLMTAGFPNMFIVTGPGSPSVKTNMVCAIEQHVDWIADCIEQIGVQKLHEIDADPSAQAQWTQHVNDVGDSTLYPLANSWYVGANVPGKPRVFTPYVAGLDVYRKKCDEIAAQNYAGFLKR